uniref:DUF223 domain-containing protein n=1 Tax=Lactuca sativa TaxID=4236 RepID=A0A9R1UW20_LACSA|nr:hypothetical protein LSAT_V11C800452350 [Lactuca sativa]
MYSIIANNADQVIFNKVAEINVSKESRNICIKVVMLWKPTYINNHNMIIGVVREISNFVMASNESEYMLVPHKHKINFYKTTKVRVSSDFVDTVDPYHFISFPDSLARNFDIRVKLCQLIPCESLLSMEERKVVRELQSFCGAVFALKLNTYISQHHNEIAPSQVGNYLFGSRLHINDAMPQILEFKSDLNALDTNVESSSLTIIIATIIGFDLYDGWYSFYCRDCSKKVTKMMMILILALFTVMVVDLSRMYLETKIRIVVRVQDESGSSSFVLFKRHVKDLIHRGNQWLMGKIAKDQGRQQIPDEFKILLNKKFVFKVQISMFNLQNNYHAYTVHKLTDDERVLAEVFKRSPNHQHHNINDNVRGKPPIEIDANTDSLEWSSSKTRAVRDTLKIQKLEKIVITKFIHLL